MRKIKQNGFSPKVIMVTVVAVLLLAAVGWRIWDAARQGQQANSFNNNQQNTNPADNQNSEQQESSPNEGYVVMKEWGVRFKPAEGLGTTVYFRAADTPAVYDRLDLSTADLIAREPHCQETGFSSITRSKERQTIYESLLAKIGDYYYYYRGSDAACSQNAANMSFESQQRSVVKQSIGSLEAAK